VFGIESRSGQQRDSGRRDYGAHQTAFDVSIATGGKIRIIVGQVGDGRMFEDGGYVSLPNARCLDRRGATDARVRWGRAHGRQIGVLLEVAGSRHGDRAEEGERGWKQLALAEWPSRWRRDLQMGTGEQEVVRGRKYRRANTESKKTMEPELS
jgi:hypothetical protein